MTGIEIAGIETELWRRGAGRSVLFLHPGMGFSPGDAFLADLARDHDVLAPWHPGFGNTVLPEGWNSVADLAYFQFDLLDSLGLEDVTLVGASFGGWVAAEMAVRGNARLSRLVLIDALGIRLSDRTTRDIADFHNTDAALLETLEWANPEGRRPDLTQLDEAALTAIVQSREAFAHYGWRPYMHNPGLARWLHRIDMPTLVMWGAQDGIVTPDYGRAYASRIDGAVFETIADAGHYPQLEQAGASAAAIRAFIAG